MTAPTDQPPAQVVDVKTMAQVETLALKIYYSDAILTGNIISWEEQGSMAQDHFRAVARYTLKAANDPTLIASPTSELTRLRAELAEAIRARDGAERAMSEEAQNSINSLMRAIKTEAERDGLREDMVAITSHARDVLTARVNSVDALTDFHSIAVDLANRVLAIAAFTPAPQEARPVQQHYTLHPEACLSAEQLADEIAKFDEAAKNAKPIDLAAFDKALRDEPRQLLPKGCVAVCEGCWHGGVIADKDCGQAWCPLRKMEPANG